MPLYLSLDSPHLYEIQPTAVARDRRCEYSSDIGHRPCHRTSDAKKHAETALVAAAELRFSPLCHESSKSYISSCSLYGQTSEHRRIANQYLLRGRHGAMMRRVRGPTNRGRGVVSLSCLAQKQPRYFRNKVFRFLVFSELHCVPKK